MPWGSIVLLLIQLAQGIFSWAQRRAIIAAEQDRQIAQRARELTMATWWAKAEAERLAGLTDAELDRELESMIKQEQEQEQEQKR